MTKKLINFFNAKQLEWCPPLRLIKHGGGAYTAAALPRHHTAHGVSLPEEKRGAQVLLSLPSQPCRRIFSLAPIFTIHHFHRLEFSYSLAGIFTVHPFHRLEYSVSILFIGWNFHCPSLSLAEIFNVHPFHWLKYSLTLIFIGWNNHCTVHLIH